ncbi:helix-turn-helix transcriptional regulator [Arenibaculum pallidiluteum]|uniref:helix-turn-helix transcriptional regulator n=1 Tax=Arenibaculum pallidiluteum TaxID=2812559 RepID=UPI001A95F682|nr:YafY family protein [Arenibaculum pallidiluteum]
MRSSRLLSILLTLQARGQATAAELAAGLEVSVRTVYRDIDALSAAGIPVYAEKGHGGGFRLLDGYRTRLTGLTAREAEALFLAGLPGPAADLGLSEATAQMRLKLLAALPETSRADAERVGERFHLDPVGWFQGPEQIALLPTLALAVWTARKVWIRYESWKGIVEREAGPLGLVLKAGLWYLVAEAGAQVRTYRVSSIRELTVTQVPFERPADFDLRGHWDRFARDYEARMQAGRATVRASPSALHRLGRVNRALADAVRQAGPPDPDGWRTVEIPVESVEIAVRELLGLGDTVEVLAPPELRQALATAVAALARLYRV